MRRADLVPFAENQFVPVKKHVRLKQMLGMRGERQHFAFGFFHQLGAYRIRPVDHQHIAFALVFKHFAFGFDIAFHAAVMVQVVRRNV